MTQAPAAIFKIPAESPQPAPGKSAKPSGRAKKAPPAGRSPVLASGNGPEVDDRRFAPARRQRQGGHRS